MISYFCLSLYLRQEVDNWHLRVHHSGVLFDQTFVHLRPASTLDIEAVYVDTIFWGHSTYVADFSLCHDVEGKSKSIDWQTILSSVSLERSCHEAVREEEP